MLILHEDACLNAMKLTLRTALSAAHVCLLIIVMALILRLIALFQVQNDSLHSADRAVGVNRSQIDGTAALEILAEAQLRGNPQGQRSLIRPPFSVSTLLFTDVLRPRYEATSFSSVIASPQSDYDSAPTTSEKEAIQLLDILLLFQSLAFVTIVGLILILTIRQETLSRHLTNRRRHMIDHAYLLLGRRCPCQCRQIDLFQLDSGSSDKHAGETTSTAEDAPKVETNPRPVNKNLAARIVAVEGSLLSNLIGIATRMKRLECLPSAPDSRWTLGLTTAKGSVRSENQDCGICFVIGNYQVAIVADGLGGLPLGREASLQAVKAAALRVVIRSNQMSGRGALSCESLARDGLAAAFQRLTAIGRRLRLQHDALRSTLIVVVTDHDHIGYAYIGDGGICIFRHAGEIIHLLHPQKADIYTPNLLSASLGPTPHGEPVFGNVKRRRQDLIIVGSDGIFDHLEERPDQFPLGTNQFVINLARGALALDGDLQAVTDQALLQLAALKDESGYQFSDNLTLALIADGEQPFLPDESVTSTDPAGVSPNQDSEKAGFEKGTKTCTR